MNSDIQFDQNIPIQLQDAPVLINKEVKVMAFINKTVQISYHLN